MEELEQKLSSENVFLQSQAVTVLYDKIIKNSNTNDDKDNEILELKQLWSLTNTGDINQANLAVQTLVSLVRSGHLTATKVLKNLLADISSAKSPLASIHGITNIFLLLCDTEGDNKEEYLISPFTGPPSGPVHPFIIASNKRPELATAILDEVDHILQHPDPRVQRSSVRLLQPVILHCLCLTDTSPTITSSLIDKLVTTYTTSPNSDIIDIFCRAASMILPCSRDNIERKLSLLTALTILSLFDNNLHLQAALLPCLVSSFPHALKYGYNTRTLERLVIRIVACLSHGCDVTLCALAHVVPQTSAATQVYLLRLGATLLCFNDGNPLVGSRLLPTLLQIVSAPCTAIPGLTAAATTLVSMVQATPAQPSANVQLAGNNYWECLQFMYSNLSSFVPAINFCNQLIKEPDVATTWLNNLASTTNLISGFHHTIVTSVFLYQGSTAASVQDAAKVLEREVVKRKSLSVELFPMVLYRLGREQDPNTKLTLLYLLPSLAVNKLCVALVLKTLLALWSSAALRPLIMKLMFEVWTVEPRVYPYLSQLISDKSVDNIQIQVARAYIVSNICQMKPSQHGEELLPILSRILNECRTEEGTSQTMLALDGIYHLCSEAVIDLRTTWRVIAPKLVRDQRSDVIIKLAQLLSLAPKFESKITSSEYEGFIENSLTILWNWATIHCDLRVVDAAYSSLNKFTYCSYKLKMLPQYARQGLKLPDALATNPFEAAKRPEDVLTYVPGKAWINLVRNCKTSQIDYIQSFMKSLVSREVAALPKGIYVTAVQEAKKSGFKGSGGKPEPPTYSFLNDNSVLKAIVNYLNDFSKIIIEMDNVEEQERLLISTHVILSAIGQSLNRPLPALDWAFLNEVRSTAEAWDAKASAENLRAKIRCQIYNVIAHQCSKSPSAVTLMTKYLNQIMSSETIDDEVEICKLLNCLGCGIPPNTLQPFLSHVLTRSIDNLDHLNKLLIAIKPHLSVDYIHDANRNVICNNIESLNEKMDPTNETVYSSYKSCVADLPLKHVERLTSPSLWWEVTDDRLYRAAVLRCHVASNDPEELALPWLNDLVDSAASLPGDRSHLLLVMADTLATRSSVKESTTWLLQLLGRLRDHLKKECDDNIVAAHEQQQRVLFYADLLVVGILIWSGLWATSTLEKLTSTPSLMDSLLPSALMSLISRDGWKETIPQILNWLVLTHKTLIPHIQTRYRMKNIILLLAIISPNPGQKLWNKIVQILL